MTQISDESGRVLLRNRYDGGFLQWQDFGNGAVY